MQDTWYRLEDIVGKWGKDLKQVADNLDRKSIDMEPFTFITDLQKIVNSCSEQHSNKLTELKDMNDQI
jgi:hypothetical protein